MFLVDDRQIRRLATGLAHVAKTAHPVAVVRTLNRAVFAGQKIARDVASGKMIERNPWTRRSIQVEKASMGRSVAVLGSRAPYMEDQEFGAVLHSRGKHGRPIPTPAASGETSLPRRRLPRKANKLRNIQLRRGVGPAARRARNRAAVMAAASGKGSRFVFLELGRRSGIYRVLGTKRAPRIRKIYDLSRRSVTLRPRPWLQPAVAIVRPLVPGYYADEMARQLRRRGPGGG